MEVAVKYFVSYWALFALLVFPFAGCSSSTNDGMDGSAGASGTAGSGGTAGAGGGGGSAASPVGLWTGSGQDAPDGPLTICFNVRDDGEALVRPVDPNQECQGNSLWVEFENCEGGFSTNEEIPIVDGAFRLLNEEGGLAGFWDISGTFDGNTASGEATTGAVGGGTCTGSWTATPSQ